jgi:hypothetical protein
VSSATTVALIRTLPAMSAPSPGAADLHLRKGLQHGVEIRRIGHDAVLDHLRQPRSQQLGRQRREDGRVHHDRAGMVKDAHEVLAVGRVDGGLATHRCVHHRQQGRRHLHDRDTAHERGGDEAGQITDHAAAQCNDGRVASGPPLRKGIGQCDPLVARLVAFTGWYREHLGPVARQSLHQLVPVQAADRLVGDDGVPMCRRDLCDDVAHLQQHGFATIHRIVERQRQRHYQVTSPAPARLFATRASMNNRSDSRFR